MDIEQNGVPVNTLDIPVGSTFTVDVLGTKHPK
jgi:hypothetical protein